MKSIQTAEQREKKRKRYTQIMGIVLAFLMLGSTIGYAFSLFFSSTQDTPIDTTPLPNQPIIVTHNGLSYALSSTPEDIASIPVTITKKVADYAGLPVFIVSEDSTATQELGGILSGYIGRLQHACYGPCESQDLPEKSCTDNLVIVKSNLTQQVYQQGQCIFIDGDIRAVDAFLYHLFRPS